MKKQFVNGYSKQDRTKEKLVFAALLGVCIVIFVITVTVAGLIMDNSKSEEGTTKVIADEDIAFVEDDNKLAAAHEKEKTETTEKTDEVEAATEALSFTSPCNGPLLKEFSDSVPIYSETLDDWRVHTAIDISAPMGSEVRSVADGVVSDSFEDFRYGYTIVIEHGNDLKSIYSNLATLNMIEVGSNVKKGQQISTVGDTTLFETVADTHLHLEMTLSGEYVNPLDYFTLTE